MSKSYSNKWKTQSSLHSRTCKYFCFRWSQPYTTSLVLLSSSTASVSHPILLSAANRFFPFEALCTQPLLPITNSFLNVRWWFKFKMDGTKLPATDASDCSLSLSLSLLYQQCSATLLTTFGQVGFLFCHQLIVQSTKLQVTHFIHKAFF